MRIPANPHLKSFCARAALLLGTAALIASASLAAQTHAKTGHLAIYTIDVEGGQSTLLVSPTGASMLVDTGWADHNGRDAERIQAAMHEAGVSRIDYLLITHYHADHVGGLPNLVARVPVERFYDHGPNREDSDKTREGYAAYLKAAAGHPRHIVHPGEKIPVPGLDIVVLTADGKHIGNVPGVKPAPNPYCAKSGQFPADPSENSRSAGILVRYGRFSFLDVGDLTDAKEVALVCPDNPIGPVDVYLVANHGMTGANARAFVFGVHPLVAIMNNGSHKGDTPDAWKTVHSSPGLEDLWQLHTGEDPGDLNSPAKYIANTPSSTDGAYLKVVASSNGSFAITNSRTGFTKEYSPK